MGVTVHYRGTIDDPDRIEDLEDRLVDFALDSGADVRIWRSASSTNSNRAVRGVILNLVPGQEPTSLLFSPEGWLIPLTDIEGAELGRLHEPPWCFVKTQFGSMEGHVRLVELLEALKREFIAGLEVTDEGLYWETRDIAKLRTTFSQLHSAIGGLLDGLRQYGLNAEAAEDPRIVAIRVKRIAQQVHGLISRPSEHPPLRFSDEFEDASEMDGQPEVTETEWDAMYKQNRRQQHRIQRVIEERLRCGESAREAMEVALGDEGILDLPLDEDTDEPFSDPVSEEDPYSVDNDESWRESLSPVDPDDDQLNTRHPMQQQAMDLMLRLYELPKRLDLASSSQFETLLRGAGEMMGGLAQALNSCDDPLHGGLCLVQLKRALRGAAYALGALIALKHEGILQGPTWDQLNDTTQQLESDIFEELHSLRARMQGDSN